MFTCKECKEEFDESARSPWVGLNRCNGCMMRRFGIQRAMESRSVVETPHGWATAKCLDGIPYRWICLHLHKSQEEAESCLCDEDG